MSVSAAAVKLGVSRQTVYAMAARGDLRTQSVAGRLVILAVDVTARQAAA